VIRNLGEARAAWEAGQFWSGYLRRSGPSLTAYAMADLSYAAGIPGANYFASSPLTAAVLAAADGIDMGPAPAPGLTKYLAAITLLPPTAAGNLTFHVHDVCLFYPFVDGDGGSQALFNYDATLRPNVPTIPRYAGAGCKLYVVSQGAGTATADCVITYTNAAGVAGRTITVTLNLLAAAGTLCFNGYLPLQAGDTGIRSIENVEYLTGGGGIQAFVIAKPLASFGMWETTTCQTVVDFLVDSTRGLPEIPTGAYIHALIVGTTTAAPASILARFDTLWG
jgi:hypothetical protein